MALLPISSLKFSCTLEQHPENNRIRKIQSQKILLEVKVADLV
jgi:hypothetical protein